MIQKKNKNFIIGLILCFIVISCLIINCKYRENYSRIGYFSTGICPKKPEITIAPPPPREEEPECEDVIDFENTDQETITEVKELVFEGLFENNPTYLCTNVESILNKIKLGEDIDSLQISGNDITDNDKSFLKKIVSESFIIKLRDTEKFNCIKNELEDICSTVMNGNINNSEKIDKLFDSSCFLTALTLTIIEANVLNPISDTSTEATESKSIEENIIKTLSSIAAKDSNNIVELSNGITEINNKQINNQFTKISEPLLMNKVIEETKKTEEKKNKILNAKFVDNTIEIRHKLEFSREGQIILDSCKSIELV